MQITKHELEKELKKQIKRKEKYIEKGKSKIKEIKLYNV
jgi:hypothetical protein